MGTKKQIQSRRVGAKVAQFVSRKMVSAPKQRCTKLPSCSSCGQWYRRLSVVILVKTVRKKKRRIKEEACSVSLSALLLPSLKIPWEVLESMYLISFPETHQREIALYLIHRPS